MNMIHLPDGPEQEARDDTFIKSAPKADAQMPVPSTAPGEDNHGRRLEDFDPPAVATGSFVPTTRAYLLEYDVYLHVGRLPTDLQRGKITNSLMCRPWRT